MSAIPAAVVGFYWPITVATAISATAMCLYCTAARNGEDAGRSAGIALGGILAVAVSLAPLAPTLGHVRCNDEGHLRTFDPPRGCLLVCFCAAQHLHCGGYTD